MVQCGHALGAAATQLRPPPGCRQSNYSMCRGSISAGCSDCAAQRDRLHPGRSDGTRSPLCLRPMQPATRLFPAPRVKPWRQHPRPLLAALQASRQAVPQQQAA
jgi:hypothetical protein